MITIVDIEYWNGYLGYFLNQGFVVNKLNDHNMINIWQKGIFWNQFFLKGFYILPLANGP